MWRVCVYTWNFVLSDTVGFWRRINSVLQSKYILSVGVNPLTEFVLSYAYLEVWYYNLFVTFVLYVFQDFNFICNVQCIYCSNAIFSLNYHSVFLVYYCLSCSYMGPTGILWILGIVKLYNMSYVFLNKHLCLNNCTFYKICFPVYSFNKTAPSVLWIV
jgi:hypothetical protein